MSITNPKVKDLILTPATITASAIAIYAAIVSTVSLVLAIRAHRTSGPVVDMRWDYLETTRELSIIVSNTGRSAVTITTLDLVILLEKTTKRLRLLQYGHGAVSTYSHTERTAIRQIPVTRWRVDDQAVVFPARLAAYSMFTVSTNKETVRQLPSQYPQDDLLLKFAAKIPRGEKAVHIGGDALRQFLASDPL